MITLKQVHKAMVQAGFADADRWRFNSGITRFEEDGQTIRFYGYSKSVYACDTRCEGFISLTRSIYNQLLTQAEAEHLVLEHLGFSIVWRRRTQFVLLQSTTKHRTLRQLSGCCQQK